VDCGVASRGLLFDGHSDPYVGLLLDCTLSLVLRGFVAVYLTFAQFNVQLKFCMYIIVHLLLENLDFLSSHP